MVIRKIILLVLLSVCYCFAADGNSDPNSLANDPVSVREFQLLLKYAEEGDIDCQFDLWRCYWAGKGVEKSFDKGIYWLEKAAEGGHCISQDLLGIIYFKGEFIERDFDKSEYWNKKAAEQNTLAYWSLGLMYITDNDHGPDFDEARKLFKKAEEAGDLYAPALLENIEILENDLKSGYEEAFNKIHALAEVGDALSQYKLGIMYMLGICVEMDLKKSVEWTKKASDQGYVPAQKYLVANYWISGMDYSAGESVPDKNIVLELTENFAKEGDIDSQAMLGYSYQVGRGVERDYEKAIYWNTKAAESGSAQACINLGLMYLHGYKVDIDVNRAVELFEKAGEGGSANALCTLGSLYYEGKVIEQDYGKSFEYFTKAAKCGSEPAMTMLGKLYFNGLGVEQDYEKAMEIFKQAARKSNGSIDSQAMIGYMYARGLGVGHDSFLAIKWLKKPAENGVFEAQCMLAYTYENDNGYGQPDIVEAYKWYYIASSEDSSVKERLSKLKAKMTEDKLVEAVKRAEELAAEKFYINLPVKKKKSLWNRIFSG